MDKIQAALCIMIAVINLLVSVNCQTCHGSCVPPDCSCPRFEYPMDRKDIPQMVYFGFDDAVNVVMSSLYERIFTPERVNPNGCRMPMTLFVSHQYTDYKRVKQFYDEGNEIAVHSVTHSNIDNDEILRREAKQQKENLAKAGVPEEEIIGWRSPFLKTAGNNQPKILKTLGYEYDISLTYAKHTLEQPKPWPFTINNGWPYRCGIEPCPHSARVEKFWEVPVVSLMDYKNSYPCSYVDGCAVRATNEEEAFKFLMNNFLSYYNTTRTPFGLNMHAAWFYTRYNLKAMIRFLQELQKYKDVYVVTVKQMLDWMKHPTPVSEIDNLRSWQCEASLRRTKGSTVSTTTTRRTTTTTTTTPSPTTTTTTTKSTTTTTTTTTPSPTTTTTTTTTTMKPTKTTTTTSPTTTTTSMKPSTTTTSQMKTTSKRKKTIAAMEHPIPWWNFWSNLQSMQFTRVTCQQGVNCKLPDCYCQGGAIPKNMKPEDTPQMVYITIDGNVNPSVYRRYRQIFQGVRNRNGCPARGTLFVSEYGTYSFVLRRMEQIGAEVAMRGLQEHHPESVQQMEQEIVSQKSTLARLGIKTPQGWKTPEHKALGNDQFKLLDKHGFLYDATLTENLPKQGDQNAWPYTLDFGHKGDCVVPECPTESFPGLWEIPVRAMLDYKKMFECFYADGCMYNPPLANSTFNYLLDNFNSHYKSNKAPFGIHLRQVWFSHAAFLPNIRGLLYFVAYLRSLPDVYLVSASEVIDWMKDPTPINQISNSKPWKC